MQLSERGQAIGFAGGNLRDPGTDPFDAFEDGLEVLFGVWTGEEIKIDRGHVPWVARLEGYETGLRARVHMYERTFILVGTVGVVEVGWNVGETCRRRC